MTFPTINYKYHGIEDAKSLTDVVEQKFAALSRLIPEKSATKCEVEFEKVATHLHGKVYRVEVNIFVNKTLYRAEATENSFEEAVNRVRDEIDSELSRAKDKSSTLGRSAGRKLKNLVD